MKKREPKYKSIDIDFTLVSVREQKDINYLYKYLSTYTAMLNDVSMIKEITYSGDDNIPTKLTITVKQYLH